MPLPLQPGSVRVQLDVQAGRAGGQAGKIQRGHPSKESRLPLGDVFEQ